MGLRLIASWRAWSATESPSTERGAFLADSSWHRAVFLSKESTPGTQQLFADPSMITLQREASSSSGEDFVRSGYRVFRSRHQSAFFGWG